MKKNITAILYLIILSLCTINSFVWSEYATANKSNPIPAEAIRLRIISNSNRTDDQEIKLRIRDQVRDVISTETSTVNSKKEAYNAIENKIPTIESIVENELQNSNRSMPYSVTLEKTKFPTKLYGDYLYPAGEYDALLISIGEGTGENWWCVLYPALCFVDFDNDTSKTKTSKKEIKEETLEEQSEEELEDKDKNEDEDIKYRFAITKFIKR